MNKYTPMPSEHGIPYRAARGPQPKQTERCLAIPRWRRAILVTDGILLLMAGLAALIADVVGYFFGIGPFAALLGQPLAIGAVEAHGLAMLVGLLVMRTTPGDHWRWHAVALAVHLFLGVYNLLFWDVYAMMGAAEAGVISTIAHAVLFSAQLGCLALDDASAPVVLPRWLTNLRRAGLYVRPIAIGTLLLGAGAHLGVIVLGREVQPRILTPAFELLLTVPMFYVSVAIWLAWRTFIFRGRWHQVALALILMYFPIGLPFHLITITTGSTAHYSVFPEQYSLLIVPVMATFIACFAGLRLRGRRVNS
jgi:hypothetical protein